MCYFFLFSIFIFFLIQGISITAHVQEELSTKEFAAIIRPQKTTRHDNEEALREEKDKIEVSPFYLAIFYKIIAPNYGCYNTFLLLYDCRGGS